MTSTPTYGFRISGTPEAGPMSQVMQAGDVKGIQDLLRQRFPGLKFETMDTELEEVDKPTEPTPVAPAPTTDVTGETTKEETTSTLYNDYMAGLPAGVRDLVTTDYKGVRGGRLGEGNYTTASTIPGAQASRPSVPSAPTPAPSTGGGATTTTTYNAPVVGGNYSQYYGDYYSGDVNYGTIGGGGETATAATSTAPQRGMQPAWTTGTKNLETTVGKASGGLVPSTVNQGAYVQPSSPEASAGAFGAFQRVQERQAAQPGNTGVLAAASGGSTAQAKGTLSLTEATAVLAAKGNDAKAAQSALKAAENGRIELTNAARNALEKAAKK